MNSTASPDVCVIGGGLLGTATAYFAACEGLKVMVLEEKDLASGASGAAFGGVSVGIYSYSSPRVPEPYVELSKASLALYHELAHALGPPFDFETPGSLDPFFDPKALETRRERAEGLRTCGVECELLSRKEVLEIEPAISESVAGATYCQVDGHVTPQNAVWAMAMGARQLGVDIRTHTRVEGIETEGGQVTGVRVNGQSISAGWVVNAAGTATPDLLSRFDVGLPMDSSRGQMFVTERVPRLLRTYIHNIKQTRSGTIVFGATRESGLMDVSTTVRGTRDVTAWATSVVPALAGIQVVRSWAGIRPIPADGYPVVGFVDGVERLLVAVMHRGVTLAPVIGRVLVDLIVRGETALDISPYRLSRFADAESGVRATVEETYYAGT